MVQNKNDFCKLEDKLKHIEEGQRELKDRQKKLESENIDFRQGLQELVLGQRIQIQLSTKLEENVSKLTETVSSLDVLAHRMDVMEMKQNHYDKKLEDSLYRFEKNLTNANKERHQETISKFKERDSIIIKIASSLLIAGIIALVSYSITTTSEVKYLQKVQK